MIFIKTNHGLINADHIYRIETHGGNANPTVYYRDNTAMCERSELVKLGIAEDKNNR